ncbi:DUF342 domain-containing protein [Halalkalibacter alkalisediminis]|uniref:DUF342 domain-containing protein n=1 Tax=Halalkalibacter alkalisediminis TaxID=935616 RepID=A0ABV6NCX9_9BACI|nr:FapA family protein [Halalkalibacter alkalisediminis]
MLTKESLLQFIHEHGVTYGMDNMVVAEISTDKETLKSRVKIASGKEPVQGERSYIQLIIFQKKDRPYQSVQNMNLKDFLEIPSVTVGDKVATKINATLGEPGYNVFGEEVPAKPGRDFTLRKGKNTRLDEEEECLYSLIDGQISIDKYTVHVQPTYGINSDLSLATGNISFVGNVNITGNVPTGFEVEAGGDIRVSGTVEAAKLKAGGSIFIGAGIVGQNRSFIEANGDLQTTFINEGSVVVEGAIEVAQAILHSSCTAGTTVNCTRGKGLIVGGSISAKRSIQVNEVGNDMHTKTNLFIGMHEYAIKQQKEMEAELKKAQDDLAKLGRLLKLLLDKEKETGELVGRDKLSKLKILNAFQLAKQKIDQLTEELKVYEDDESQEEEGFISFTRTIYQNVDVHFGKYRRRILSEFHRAQIALIDFEIKINTN